MNHEVDALLANGPGENSSETVGSRNSGSETQEVLRSPGELEVQHHALLEQQGRGSDQTELITEACEFVARGRAVGAMLEDPRVRHHCQSVLDYWSIFIYRNAQQEIDADLLPFDSSLAPSLDADRFPYRFEEDVDDPAQQMLGWRRLLDECEQDLATDRLLTVMGEVGAGAPLLVHGLMVPILRSGRARLKELSGSDQWRYYEVELGENPAADILTSIAIQHGHDAQWIAQQEIELAADPTTLIRILGAGTDRSAALIFSRFGQLLKIPRAQRMPILDNLATLLEDPQKRFFATAILHRNQTVALAKFGPLEKRLRDGHVRMAFTTAELRHLIEEPARRIGLVFEPGLIDQVLIDIQGEATALPLLRFTLKQLWNRRERNRITWSAYDQIGGGRTALSRTMEHVYNHLDQDQRKTLRRILLTMVNLEPDGSFSARDVSRDDLYDTCGNTTRVRDVLERLQQHELIRQGSERRRFTFTIAYGALLTSWTPLVTWLDELRVKQRFHLRLRQAATLWNDRGRSKDLLWQGAMLVEAKEEFGQDESLATNERDFLRDSERREKVKRHKRHAAITGAALAVLVGVILLFQVKHRTEHLQRLYGSATDSLGKGDVPGVLLWLEQLDALSTWMAASPDEARKIRQLAQLQLPELHVLATVHDEKTQSFLDIALSSDQKHLATIHREKGTSPVHDKLSVLIFSRDTTTEDFSSKPEVIAEGVGDELGAVAFAELGSTSARGEYLLIGGDRLRAWQFAGGIWTPKTIQLRHSEAKGPIVSIAAGGDSLLTIHQKQNSKIRHLQHWKIGTHTDTVHLQLTQKLPEISNKSVQVARVSNEGHILAVCGSEPSEATELMMWVKRKDSEHWVLASPPDWAARLAGKDEQRLYDWGWEPNGVGTWQRKNSYIRTVAFSPECTQFATACDDGQVLTWEFSERTASDGEQGPSPLTPKGLVTPRFETELQLGSSVFDVAFASEDVIVTAGRDRTVRIWDIHAAAEVAPRTYHEGSVDHVRFGDSGIIVTNTTPTLRIFRSHDYGAIVSPDAVQQLARSSDNEHIAYVPIDPDVEVLGGLRNATPIGASDVQSTVVSPDGNWALTASQSVKEGATSMNVWRGDNFEQPLPLMTSEEFEDAPLAAFSPSGQRLAVAHKARSDGAPKVVLCDLQSLVSEGSGNEVPYHELRLPARVEADSTMQFENVAFTELGGQDLLVVIGKEKLRNEPKARGIIFIATEKQKGSSAPLTLQRLNVQAPNAHRAFPHDEEVLCLAFSSDGQLLATGDAADRVKLWRLEDFFRHDAEPSSQPIIAKPVGTLQHSSDVKHLAFGPRGTNGEQSLATVSSEGEASIWSIARGRDYAEPDYRLQHDAKILSISFSPDGRWIITGGADRTARVWDSEDGQPVGVFRHRGPVVDAWLSGDGDVLTVSRSSRVPDSGKEPPLHVRHWAPSSQQQDELSKEYLQRLAARKVENFGFEVLRPSDFVRDR